MSGQTPVAMSWSIGADESTSTPLRRMISIDMSIRPCVCDCSGERFSVQLMYRRAQVGEVVALSSTIRSCISFIAISSLTGLLLDQGLRSEE